MKFAAGIIMFLSLLITSGATAGASEKPAQIGQSLKQREFIKMLVPAFDWQQGLPENPQDNDYLAILGGRRSYRYEAEEYYGVKTDDAVVREFNLYGPFSGKGWVSGVAVPTTIHFKLFIPIKGNYTLTVASKGDGQAWTVGGRSFEVSTGNKLRETVAGTAYLKAGDQEIVVNLPPEGGIDYFILEAPKLGAVEPLEGWSLESPLTMGQLAEVSAAVLGWESALPNASDGKSMTAAVAETAVLPSNVLTTDVNYLGKFSAKKWVRAGYGGAHIELPLNIDATAVYNLKIRTLGNKVVTELDGRQIASTGKPYLDLIDLGLYRLKVGKHILKIDLDCEGGVDVVILETRRSSPADYMTLVGLEGKPDEPVTRDKADKIITSLIERFTERR